MNTTTNSTDTRQTARPSSCLLAMEEDLRQCRAAAAMLDLMSDGLEADDKVDTALAVRQRRSAAFGRDRPADGILQHRSRRAARRGGRAHSWGGVVMTTIPNEITSAAVSLPDLAAQFAELYPRWCDYKNRRHAEHEEFEERVLAATGMTFDEAEARGGILFENYRAVRKQIIDDDKQTGLLDDDDPEEIIWDEIEDIASAILKASGSVDG